MNAEKNVIDTPELCMAYVMNCVEGMAFSHLKPRSQDNAIEP